LVGQKIENGAGKMKGERERKRYDGKKIKNIFFI
jgi:hypothetical protein